VQRSQNKSLIRETIMNYLQSTVENNAADANDSRIHVDNDFTWNYREIQFELNGAWRPPQ
jgi:hypothetical protein